MRLNPEHAAPDLGEQAGPADTRLHLALSQLYQAAPSPQLRDVMDHAVLAHIAAAPEVAPVAPGHRLHLLRLRPALAGLTALATVLALTIAGAIHGNLTNPTPVSAQTIAHRAAAAQQLAPNQAAHATYTVFVSGIAPKDAGTDGNAAGADSAKSPTFLADVWVQTDASGSVTASAQSIDAGKGGVPSRFIQIGQQTYAYNPEMRGDDVITINATRGNPSWLMPNDVFDSVSATQELNALATQSPGRVQLLPRQTLDGHLVDVIQVDGWTNRPAQRTIFYIDAQSYVLRGFDASSFDPSYPTPSWQSRLNDYTTMPATSVPTGAFTLNAPATATVTLNDLADPATAAAFSAAFQTICNSGPTASFKQSLRSGQSPLAACQTTAPTVTQDSLVAALAASAEPTLAAAVTAGQITSLQATNSGAAYRSWLTTWVSTPLTDLQPGATGRK